MAGLFDPKFARDRSMISNGLLGRLGQPSGRNMSIAQASERPLRRLGELFAQPVKRRAFFSFHFDDVMRANNVRQSWRHHNPGSLLVSSFTDSSLWESKKLDGPEALKKLIREGVEYSSAVCVLVGSETWLRRWVKYEIARSVIDKRGLLAVHINRLNHHKRQAPDAHGLNPLDYMAVGKDAFGRYHLYEKRAVLLNYITQQYGWEWHRYSDFSLPVSLPAYLRDPPVGYVMPLSSGTSTYCYIGHLGHYNIGTWIDRAAQLAGR